MDLGICIAEQGATAGTREGPPCYASVSGSPPVFYDSISRLPKDVLWVSNLRVEDLANVQSWRTFLRGADYLGINVKHICADLGVGMSFESQVEKIYVLSLVLTGLQKKYLNKLELDLVKYPYNIHSSIKDKFFSFLGEKVANYEPKLAEWINGCVQATTECRHGTYNFGPRVCIRENAYRHACSVFDSPTPTGRHGYFPASKFGSTREQVVQKLLDMDMFSICRLSKIKAKRGQSGIFGYGQMFANKTSTQEQRSHATNYELAFMNEIFDFEVDEVLLFEGYDNDKGDLSYLIHDFDPLNSLAYGAMLYYVNLIRARVDRWRTAPTKDGRAQGLRSPLCSMIYGVRDRMLTYSMAQQLANCDIGVHSYRNGYVFIDSDQKRELDLINLAKQNAWMYPA